MFGKMWRGALALGAAVFSAGIAHAEGDTFRLVDRPAADDATTQTLTLRPDNDAETILTRGRGGFGGGFRGGFRGGFGGYRGGFGRGFVGYRGFGYRGFGYGYRPWYGYGIGIGLGYGYGGYGYGGYGYGGYGYGYSPWYGCSTYISPSYYYTSAMPYYGASNQVAPQILTLNTSPVPAVMPRIGDEGGIPMSPRAQPQQPQSNPGGTFPYDGGPAAPVPGVKDKDSVKPPAERAVSLPAERTKYSYAAYGEQLKLQLKPRDVGKTVVVSATPR
jgi:hypothetical protein